MQEPERKRGKTPRAGECTAWGPGRRAPRGIAQGRGFWRPRPRCFPRGYYELSVPGRRPGTFRAPPPRSAAGAGQTAPPSRRAGTPCTSPPGCAAPASGAETPAPLMQAGTSRPRRRPASGRGDPHGGVRARGARGCNAEPRDHGPGNQCQPPTPAPPPARHHPPPQAAVHLCTASGSVHEPRCAAAARAPRLGLQARRLHPALPPGPATLTSLRPR